MLLSSSRRAIATASISGLVIAAALSPSPAHAYGEPTAEGLPNREERLLHVLTNQVRAEPHAWPDWDTKLATAEARPPVMLDDALFEAARFHADDMASNDFFAHESFDGTSFGDRVSRFFSGPAGENIYMSYASGARDGVTAWMNSEGHRINILTAAWTSLGTGNTSAGSKHYYVQDFGERRSAKVPAIPGGATEAVGGSQVLMIANWFDAQGRAPMTFEAHLGDAVHTLAKIAGADGNATFEVGAAMPAGCEPLSFVAVDQSGKQTVFPTTGTLLAGKTCAAVYMGGPTNMMMGGDDRPIIDASDSGCRCVLPRDGRETPASTLALFSALASGALIIVRRKRRARLTA